MKKILSLAISILLATSADAQQVLNLLTGEVREGSDAEKPEKTVEILDDGYLVTYNFTEALINKDPYLTNCILWEYSDYMVSDINGTPAFPYQNNFLDIDDCMPTLMVEDSSYVDYSYQLAPAYPEQPVSNPYSEVERLPINPYLGFLPSSTIKTIGFRRFSGRRQVLYTIYPIQYNYESHIVRAYTHISVKVLLSNNTNKINESPFDYINFENEYMIDGCLKETCVSKMSICNGKIKLIKNK